MNNIFIIKRDNNIISSRRLRDYRVDAALRREKKDAQMLSNVWMVHSLTNKKKR